MAGQSGCGLYYPDPKPAARKIKGFVPLAGCGSGEVNLSQSCLSGSLALRKSVARVGIPSDFCQPTLATNKDWVGWATSLPNCRVEIERFPIGLELA